MKVSQKMKTRTCWKNFKKILLKRFQKNFNEFIFLKGATDGEGGGEFKNAPEPDFYELLWNIFPKIIQRIGREEENYKMRQNRPFYTTCTAGYTKVERIVGLRTRPDSAIQVDLVHVFSIFEIFG